MPESPRPFNPFPGLRPFEPDENFLFFGRDQQTNELVRRLLHRRFVAVLGTSGSGKSSLVRAGLLPALHGGLSKAGAQWRIAVFRPGHAPVVNLALALNAAEVFDHERQQQQVGERFTEITLRRGRMGLLEAVQEARLAPAEQVLLVIDQFEELFRFKRASVGVAGENEAAAFVKLFLTATQHDAPIYVVITMRSDFLGDCAQFRDLPEAINDSQYLVPRMTREQRRQAITGPIAVGGAQIAPRLVNRLLNEAGDHPDQLPILQHAVRRTWDHWQTHHHESEPLDLRHYEAIGGMETALNRHANEAFAELALQQTPETGKRRQRLAEKLFRSITAIDAEGHEMRQPLQLRDLCKIVGAEEAEVTAVIEVFRQEGRSFLTPKPGVPLTGDSWIDISHESLMRQWETLRGWVNAEMASARVYKHLAETAALHREKKHGYLRDPELQNILAWQKQQQPNITWAARYHGEFETAMAFLRASLRRMRALMSLGLVLITLAVYFLFKIDLFEKLDGALHRYFMKPHPALVIVEIDENTAEVLQLRPEIEAERIRLRLYHSGLVRILAEKGAKVLAFDICFVDSSAYDGEFNHAIVAAQARGTAVVAGVRCGDDEEPAASLPALGESYGDVRYFNTGEDFFVRLDEETAPFALKMLQSYQADSALTSNLPQAGSTLYISFVDSLSRMPRLSYGDVLLGSEPVGGWQDKIVLIGYKISSEYYIPQNMEEGRWGPEVHANALNNLLQMPLNDRRWLAGLFVVIAALNALLFRWIGTKIEPALLILLEGGLFVALAFLIYRFAHVLLPIAVAIGAIIWSLPVLVLLAKAKWFPQTRPVSE